MALAEGLDPAISHTALAEGAEAAPLHARLLAEFVGTFFLVLTVGVAVASKTPFAPLAIGLILSIQIYTFGSVSGGLFNPAVTLAVLLSGRNKITPQDAACYMGTQFLGGIAAALLALSITDDSFGFDHELTRQGWSGTSMALELLYTAALCHSVLVTGTSTDTPNEYFGFAIGGTVMASAFACHGFDQGSFNPAVTLGINVANAVRDKGPNPSAGAWFLFLLAPFLGAVLAFLVFRATRGSEYKEMEDDSAPMHTLVEKAIAECVGTFYLVLTVGVAVVGGGAFAPIAIGLTLGIQVYCFGSVSGACLNPAVTLSVVVSGRNKIPPLDAAVYVAAECVGALVAASMAYAITDKTFGFDYDLLKEGGAGESFALELFFTMALCNTVLATGTSLDAPNQYFGFAIGGTVTAAAYTNTGFNQGSFNPAVTLGINFVNLMNDEASHPEFGSWALFLIAPALGGVIAALLYRDVRAGEYRDPSLGKDSLDSE